SDRARGIGGLRAGEREIGTLVVRADRRAGRKSQGRENTGKEALLHVRSLRRRATRVKKSGTKSVAMKVAASIPPTTPVPMERRAPAPAPVESMSGSTPSTKASEVMT